MKFHVKVLRNDTGDEFADLEGWTVTVVNSEPIDIVSDNVRSTLNVLYISLEVNVTFSAVFTV